MSIAVANAVAGGGGRSRGMAIDAANSTSFRYTASLLESFG
jgi:hypothetical protein